MGVQHGEFPFQRRHWDDVRPKHLRRRRRRARAAGPAAAAHGRKYRKPRARGRPPPAGTGTDMHARGRCGRGLGDQTPCAARHPLRTARGRGGQFTTHNTHTHTHTRARAIHGTCHTTHVTWHTIRPTCCQRMWGPVHHTLRTPPGLGFPNGPPPQPRFEMCFAPKHGQVLGAKRLDSRTKNFNPHLIYDCFSRP